MAVGVTSDCKKMYGWALVLGETIPTGRCWEGKKPEE